MINDDAVARNPNKKSNIFLVRGLEGALEGCIFFLNYDSYCGGLSGD
jgi:hypothetical protein